jgi:hypothetical protein
MMLAPASPGDPPAPPRGGMKKVPPGGFGGGK